MRDVFASPKTVIISPPPAVAAAVVVDSAAAEQQQEEEQEQYCHQPPPPPPTAGPADDDEDDGAKSLSSDDEDVAPRGLPPRLPSEATYPKFQDAVLWRLVHGGVDVMQMDVEGLVRDWWVRCRGDVEELPKRTAALAPAEVRPFLRQSQQQADLVVRALKGPPAYVEEDDHRGPPGRYDDDDDENEPTEYYEVVKKTYSPETRAKMERAFAAGAAEVCQVSIGSEAFVGEAVFHHADDHDVALKVHQLQYASKHARARLASVERDAAKTYRLLQDYQRRIVTLEKIVRQLARHNNALQKRLDDQDHHQAAAAAAEGQGQGQGQPTDHRAWLNGRLAFRHRALHISLGDKDLAFLTGGSIILCLVALFDYLR